MLGVDVGNCSDGRSKTNARFLIQELLCVVKCFNFTICMIGMADVSNVLCLLVSCTIYEEMDCPFWKF